MMLSAAKFNTANLLETDSIIMGNTGWSLVC